jgi:hypothetical protein
MEKMMGWCTAAQKQIILERISATKINKLLTNSGNIMNKVCILINSAIYMNYNIISHL